LRMAMVTAGFMSVRNPGPEPRAHAVRDGRASLEMDPQESFTSSPGGTAFPGQ
jgi:hypothetical protein